MCYRGSRIGADGREFAGFGSVGGGVRGILGFGCQASAPDGGSLRAYLYRPLLVVDARSVRYTNGVSFLRIVAF